MVESLTKQDWLIVANGELSKKQLLSLSKKRKILVCDGAYNKIQDMALKIDILIGDFDSINQNALKKLSQTNCQIITALNQNATDLEKALQYIKYKACSVIVFGATGLDLDHTLYNLNLLKKFHNILSLKFITKTQEIFLLENSCLVLKNYTNKIISLFAYNQAIITTQGLQYELKNYQINTFQSSARNKIIAVNSRLTVLGTIIIFLQQK